MRSGEQPCPFDVWAPSDFFFHHLSRGRANSGAQSVLGPPRDVTVAVLGQGVGEAFGFAAVRGGDGGGGGVQ